MVRPVGDLSVNPASGYYANTGFTTAGAVKDFAIPQGLSFSAAESGYQQQSFLGASIRNFSISAGFGDNVSAINIDLVNDEFNVSDKTGAGDGDDPYHSGLYDNFAPPPVGSPVFFKFGKERATVSQAYYPLYNEIYNYTGSYDTKPNGKFHFCFGGILQSYVENRGPNGDPVYSVQVVDPREILSSVILIMNNYAGSTYGINNIYNLYGFLEYNPSPATENAIASNYAAGGSSILYKSIQNDGSYTYQGSDMYWSQNFEKSQGFTNLGENVSYPKYDADYPALMPITGTGFSRRGPNGMPYYRIKQSLNALLGINGQLPKEYREAGFGGLIKFRGLKYIVDLSGLPDDIPNFYFMDFDQINLLDFCLEICDITSHELFVSLLPIINHPVSKRFYDYNQGLENTAADHKNAIAGIIRIDAINKSYQPEYGAIKKYLDTLDAIGIPIENRDIGFELTNVTTDKFLVGAQEVDMYYFSNNNDRGLLQNRLSITGAGGTSDDPNQWTLQKMLKQQILPYYGMIGKGITIPKGYGPYKQILLDSSSLYAAGVGNYYVATEMELRAAAVSYEKWSEFLLMYNNIYMQSMETDDIYEGTALGEVAIKEPIKDLIYELSQNYAVTVPRSVWPGFNEVYESGISGIVFTPIDSCNPPYGYPLYFKRAEKLGVNGVGLTKIQSDASQLVTDLARVYGDPNSEDYSRYLDSELKNIENTEKESCGDLSESDSYRKALIKMIKDGEPIGIIRDGLNGSEKVQKAISKMQKRTKENSMRVYNWLKKIADECLGKKFLVKIPRYVNLSFSKEITTDSNQQYLTGPFGFRPRKLSVKPDYQYTNDFKTALEGEKVGVWQNINMIEQFLTKPDSSVPNLFNGALEINYNPIINEYQTNYDIEPQGGYADYDLINYFSGIYPLAIYQGLLPIDLDPLMNGNRLGAYVRFDHSENLAFDNLNSSDFTQQSVSGSYFIPDIASNFDNLSSTEFSFPNDISNQGQAKENDPIKNPSITFVKCEVDDKFYMPPKMSVRQVAVHAEEVIDIGQLPLNPVKRFNEDNCECENLIRLYVKHLVPAVKTDGGTKVDVLDFNRRQVMEDGQSVDINEYAAFLEDLDTDHVYALITLPSKIVPKADKRFLDGPMSDVNTEVMKHILTADVVKIAHFNKPQFPLTPDTDYVNKFKSSLSPSTVISALNARKAALDGLQFGFPVALQQLEPSPVYPDLVAIPLLSKERCYGPWMSSYFKKADSQAVPPVKGSYANLEGRIDFIKDENLSPWNFNGFDLMNEAGRLQVKFSNSVVLQSERGGAVIPTAPSGIYLGKYLNKVGPLLSNLSVDVSDAGVRTTFKFDLYTVSFGKLAKQKQEQIANISRERQRLKDERNSLIRKRLGKNQGSVQFSKEYNNINNMLQNTKPITTISLSAVPRYQGVNRVGEEEKAEDLEYVDNVASMSDHEQIGNMAGYFEPDDAATRFNRSASLDISTLFLGVDQSPAPNRYLNQLERGISDDAYYS